MSAPLEKRLKECDEKIDALFQGMKLNAEIESQLRELKAYYYRLYIEALDDEAEKESIEIYELFTRGLEGIKNGQLKSEEVLKEIKEIKSLRKSGIVLENIFTALELLFWATLSSSFFSYCVYMAPPLVAFNPFFALALLSISCMAAIYATVNFFNCIDEFKSITPIEEEFKREKDLISFFKPWASVSEISSKVTCNEENSQKEHLYILSQ